jgi:succinylglutamate desuccinylase
LNDWSAQGVITALKASIQALADSGLYSVQIWADGIWQIRPVQAAICARFLISMVVHGDETGPVHLITRLLCDQRQHTTPLPVELIVVLGNLEAHALNRRYVEQDMNRLFAVAATLANTADARRALVLRQTLESRLWEATALTLPLIHLDLHSTIRASLKPTFAIVPCILTRDHFAHIRSPWVSWLLHSGLNAVVLASDEGPTFSAYSARHGAWSCTLELGQVAAANSGFKTVDHEALMRALAALLRQPLAHTLQKPSSPPKPGLIYRATQEVIRSSPIFEWLLPRETINFTLLAPNQLVARDGANVVRAQYPGECVLFPNPNVAVGLRAALLVAPVF